MALTTLGFTEVWQNGTANFLYLAIGNGTTAFDVGQTALQGTELARIPCSVDIAGALAEFGALFTASQGSGLCTEWGIFNAASGGTMWARGLFDEVVNKTAEAFKAVISETLQNYAP